MWCPGRQGTTSPYRSNASTESVSDTESYYHINVFNPMLDQVIGDLSERFTNHQRQSLLLFRFMPHDAPKASWDQVKQVVDKYNAYLDPCDHAVRNEFALWQEYCSRMKSAMPCAVSAVCALTLCSKQVYPNIHTLLQILATLPVSTAEPGWMFLKVEKTLTETRSTMAEDRLEALVLLQAHRKRLIDVTNDEIVKKFAACGSRKLQFSFIL